jgi:uncharacterized protein (TIGR02246 family)
MEVDQETAASAILADLERAWNAHDPTAWAAAFHEDADFTNVFGMHARGRRDIESFHTPIFATVFKDSRLAFEPVRVRRLRRDVASLDVRWRMAGARDPRGGEWPQRRGLINATLTRERGRWAIAVLHNMELAEDGRAQAQEALSAPAGQPAGSAQMNPGTDRESC